MFSLIRRRPFTVVVGTLASYTIAAPYTGFTDTGYEPSVLRYGRIRTENTIRTLRILSDALMLAADYKFTWLMHPDRPADIIADLHQRGADRILAMCITHGGLTIKLGQHLSSLNHVLPIQYMTTLSVLHDQAPVSKFASVECVFKEDFQMSMEELFESFEPEPFAAASLAQVHRATLRSTGESLAVKIQHPHLHDQFDGDMYAHLTVLRLAKYLFDFDMVWAHYEVKEQLLKELDFTNEADNLARCRKNFHCDDPSSAPSSIKNTGLVGNGGDVYAPRVIYDALSKRVLCMEFCSGCKINDVKAIESYGLDPSEALYLFISAIASQIFLHGFIHVDPHPGNVFVRPNPMNPRRAQIILLDHGLYRELTPNVRIAYCKIWHALVMNDDDEVARQSWVLGVRRHDLFAMALLMRPYGRRFGSDLRTFTSMPKEVIKQLQEELKDVHRDLLEVLETMPRELLLVLRNHNYVRFITKDMGGSSRKINRFIIFARFAMKGINITDESVVHGSFINRFFFNVLRSWLHWWSTVLPFEVRLFSHTLTISLKQGILVYLAKLGIIQSPDNWERDIAIAMQPELESIELSMKRSMR